MATTMGEMTRTRNHTTNGESNSKHLVEMRHE